MGGPCGRFVSRPGALGTDGKCQNPTSKTVDIVAGPRNCFSCDVSKLPITSSARGLTSISHQLAYIAYRFIHQSFEIRQVKRECTGPVMTISIVGPCPLNSFFRETAMVVSTYLMPSFEEFQDVPPSVLLLCSETDKRAVKNPFVFGFVRLIPFWG